MCQSCGGLSVWEMDRKIERYNLGFYFLPLILEEWQLQGPRFKNAALLQENLLQIFESACC